MINPMILLLCILVISDMASGGETVFNMLSGFWSLLGMKKAPALMNMSPKDEIVHDDKIKAMTNFGNEIKGVSVDLGTKQEAKDNNAVFYSNGKVNMYLNIPYVKPLTTKRRFLLAEEWENKDEEMVELNARNANNHALSKFGNFCTQQLYIYIPGVEDCLYVNVITPPKSEKKHPVYVQIHGGGLGIGAAKEFDYRGPIRQLVSKGIIFVSFNYRVGPYGFLKLFDQNDKEYKSGSGDKYKDYRHNIGVEDCIMALKWVRRNITHFGGDPENIVAGGVSSGSSILELILLTLNQKGKAQHFDLFHRVALFAGTMDVSTQSFFLVQNISETCKEGCKSWYPDSQADVWKCLRQTAHVCMIRYAVPSAGLDDRTHPQILWALNTPDVVKGRLSDVARGLFNHWTPLKTDMDVFFVESREEWAYYDQIMKPLDLNYDQIYLIKLAKIFLKPYEAVHGEGWANANAKKFVEEMEKVYTVEFYEERNGAIKEKGINNLAEKYNYVRQKWPLTKAERYTMTMRALTNMLWSVRMLEDGKRMSSRGHKVYMMRFSHDMVFPKSRETPFMKGDNPRDIARAIPHGQETRYFLMHYKHYGKPNFQHKEELKVADKTSDFLSNFIIHGNPNHGNPAFHVAEKDKPQFFEISSSHKGIETVNEKKVAKKFEVHVTPKEEWLSSEVVKFWCKFFKANGMTPFTYEERTKKDVNKVRNIPLAMCGDKMNLPNEEIKEDHVQPGDEAKTSQHATVTTGADLSSNSPEAKKAEEEESEGILLHMYNVAAGIATEYVTAIDMLQEHLMS